MNRNQLFGRMCRHPSACRVAIAAAALLALAYTVPALCDEGPGALNGDSEHDDDIIQTLDQAGLARIAEDDSVDPRIRVYVIQKLTDVVALKKVATMVNRLNTGYMSVAEDYVASVPRAAIRRITDQGFLAKVASGDGDISVRMQAIACIGDRRSLAGLARDADSHLGQIARLRIFLTQPAVTQQLGPTAVTVDRDTIGQRYYGTMATMGGEVITISVTGDNLSKDRSDTYRTDFPPTTTSFAFRPAEMNIGPLVRRLLEDVPTPELSRIGAESKDPLVQEGVKSLTDESPLAPGDAAGSELEDAARVGDATKVQTLVEGDLRRVLLRDGRGMTPLHWAARNGHKAVAELLLASKAGVNAKDNLGMTPLHWAVRNDHRDIVELLLANGADVNALDREGWAPLDYGQGLYNAHFNSAVVDTLIEHGGRALKPG